MVAVLLATIAGAVSQTSAGVENGYYYGRSANLILQPAAHVERESVLLIKDSTERVIPYPPQRSSTLNDNHVADIVTRSFGLPVVNSESVVPSFIKGDFYLRPRANLFILGDSLAERVEEMPSVKALFSGAGSASLRVRSTSFPMSTLTEATTILSGNFPSEHGIVSPIWQSQGGEKVTAFTRATPASWNKAANVADLFAQSFSGQALVASVSGDAQLAATSGVSPLLSMSHPKWRNHLSSSFNENSLTFEGASSLSVTELKTLLNDDASVFGRLKAAGILVSLTDDVVTITADGKSAPFNLNEAADVMALMEVHAASSFAASLKASHNDLIGDDVPDFFAVSFAAVAGASKKHGADSTHAQVLTAVLNQVIPSVVAQFEALYPGRLLTEAVLVATPTSLPNSDSVLATLKTVIPAEDLSEFLPAVYTNRMKTTELCATLPAKLGSSVTVVCPEATKEVKRQFFLQASAPTNKSGLPSSDDVIRYQIVLWFSIAMGFILIGVVYNVAFMSFKRDSLIFSTFNPNWEDRGGRGGRH